MLVVGMNAGHDGAAVAIEDGKLRFSLESEKDSFGRHHRLTPITMMRALELVGDAPDVLALGGWSKDADAGLGRVSIGAGYVGARNHAMFQRSAEICGKRGTLFTSSHERSHIMMAIGMAPKSSEPLRAVLCWEAAIGRFYLVDDKWDVKSATTVLDQPGARYSFLFGLADPSFPDGAFPRLEDAGKLMALAAFARPEEADREIAQTVERILKEPTLLQAPKSAYRDSPIYNIGVEAAPTKIAAALLTERIFEVYADYARTHIPAGLPLHISGGCGLNCDWNTKWRELGHFSSVFVPPCTNDAGSAIGTAIDALARATGDPFIEWDVYSGLEFEWDVQPDGGLWNSRPLHDELLADALMQGRVIAWVQGRWEIGPRALGNRSLLAEPFKAETRDRLNLIKQRESYRPIAPICLTEDLAHVFDRDFEDPYMLYFRLVKSGDYAAVTHVDGSARCQTVSQQSNRRLHDLLSAFKSRSGVGLLCNTSLNFKGYGFINRMSDLVSYCEARGIDDFVVGDTWFQARPDARAAEISRTTSEGLWPGPRRS